MCVHESYVCVLECLCVDLLDFVALNIYIAEKEKIKYICIIFVSMFGKIMLISQTYWLLKTQK